MPLTPLIARYAPHYRAAIRLGVPIMIGQAGTIVLSFADTLMIGHHSTPELAAASFVNTVFTLCIIFSTGFSFGLTPIVSGHFANGRHAEAGSALLCSQAANLLVALLLTLLMTVLYYNVHRLGQPEELLPHIRPYYLTQLVALVFVMLFSGFRQFTDGITDTRTGMWILLGGNALNIVGNWLLIYGHCGFPEMGLLGAGISTLVARVLMVVVYAGLIGWGRRFAPYRRGMSPRRGWSRSLFLRLQALGWPIGLQMGMETASFTLSAVMIGWLGTVPLASHQVMITISQFTYMMYCGMGAATAVRVSYFQGQGDRVNVRRSAFASMHLLAAMAVVLLGVLFAMRGRVGGWFTDDQEVVSLVSTLFYPFLLFQVGDLLQICFSNALRGISDVRPMMVVAFVAYFLVSLPVAYVCGFLLDWGAVGVWMGFPFGLTTAGVLFLIRFRSKTRG